MCLLIGLCALGVLALCWGVGVLTMCVCGVSVYVEVVVLGVCVCVCVWLVESESLHIKQATTFSETSVISYL